MRVERELMRGAGPVAVLKLLDAGAMYGYELVEALDRRSSGVLAMGQSTLYPLLYNLEAQGLIKAEWRDGESGRQRKYYALTAAGKRRLASDMKQWAVLGQAMEALGILPQGGTA
jgi:PadR family transcriptional regulator